MATTVQTAQTAAATRDGILVALSQADGTKILRNQTSISGIAALTSMAAVAMVRPSTLEIL
jgi:hypothetical protein